MDSTSPVYSNLSDLVLSEKVYKDKADLLFKFVSVMEDHDGLGSPGIFMMIRPRGFGLSLIAQSISNLIKKDKEETATDLIKKNSSAVSTYKTLEERKQKIIKATQEHKKQAELSFLRENTDEVSAGNFIDNNDFYNNSNADDKDDVKAEIEAIKSFYNIQERPILNIDFKFLKAKNSKEFSEGLLDVLQEQFWINHIESPIDPFQTPKVYFTKLIDLVQKKNPGEKLVILIDNYDVPFIVASELDEEMKNEAISDYLDMLNVIKYSNKCVKWCLLTGHVNFSLASETSEGLPLVTDLSCDPMFAALFGLTKNDVAQIYKNEIEKFSKNFHMTSEEYLDALEKCYGGFLFADNDELITPDCPKMICPACIAHCMTNNGKLLPYSASGHYPFLSKALKNNPKDLGWLYGKDGQDPLFSDSIEPVVKGKKLGTLLIQLGFATRAKVIINQTESYITWRYRYEFPNLDMKKTFKVITNNDDELEEDLLMPLDLNESTDYENKDEE